MVITLEKRNELVAEKNQLKSKLEDTNLSFMDKLELKDQLLEVEKQLGEAKLWDGDVDERENCSG